MLLTLYIRREPCTLRNTGATLCTTAQAHRTDRVLYRDSQATEQVSLHPWWHSGGPNRRSKIIIHNCWRYRLVWLDDLRLKSEADRQRHIASMPVHLGCVRTREIKDIKGNRALIAYSC
jgi:hypothetical protein